MKINIKATGIELTPSIREYAESRVESLEKFIHTDVNPVLAEVEVGMTTHHHKSGEVFRAELNLSLGGKKIFAEAKADDLYAAIDEMRDKAERECRSFKDKEMTLTKKGNMILKKIIHRYR